MSVSSECISDDEAPTAEDLAFIDDDGADMLCESDSAAVSAANIIPERSDADGPRRSRRQRRAPLRWEHPDEEVVLRQLENDVHMDVEEYGDEVVSEEEHNEQLEEEVYEVSDADTEDENSFIPVAAYVMLQKNNEFLEGLAVDDNGDILELSSDYESVVEGVQAMAYTIGPDTQFAGDPAAAGAFHGLLMRHCPEHDLASVSPFDFQVRVAAPNKMQGTDEVIASASAFFNLHKIASEK